MLVAYSFIILMLFSLNSVIKSCICYIYSFAIHINSLEKNQFYNRKERQGDLSDLNKEIEENWV